VARPGLGALPVPQPLATQGGLEEAGLCISRRGPAPQTLGGIWESPMLGKPKPRETDTAEEKSRQIPTFVGKSPVKNVTMGTAGLRTKGGWMKAGRYPAPWVFSSSDALALSTPPSSFLHT